eukprot:m.48491 g.48491  ORF g.48491 m.48491 type:complete len:508 (-) comp11045_c0_seq1:343-1866(-)
MLFPFPFLLPPSSSSSFSAVCFVQSWTDAMLAIVEAFIDHPIFQLFKLDVPLIHLVVELALVAGLISLWLSNKYYRPRGRRRPKLTEQEEEQLIKEWEPAPLAETYHTQKRARTTGPVLQGVVGTHAQVAGKNVINMASFNFLGLVGDSRVEEAAVKSVRKYGVGSCGPRGFYGTIDCHTNLEKDLAAFMGAEECALYSYGFSTIASVIPAYSKRGDIIFCDEAAGFAIQKGCEASRSKIILYNHVDMKDLEQKLEKTREDLLKKGGKQMLENTRQFIVTEGIFQNTAQMTPLDKLVALKYKYKARIFMDESFSFGVVGEQGRGLTEHFNVNIEDVDCIAVSAGTSLASIGGFACGRAYVIDHQRLSGQGYCFSASLPPLLANAAIETLRVMQTKEGVDLIAQLHKNVAIAKDLLAKVPGVQVTGDTLAPFLHLSISKNGNTLDDEALAKLSDDILAQGTLVAVSSYIRDEEQMDHPSTIRWSVSAKHTKEDLENAVSHLKAALEAL